MKRKRNSDKSKKNKKRKISINNNIVMNCGICFEDLKTQGEIDSCNHNFCFDCIKKWSDSSNTCPVCRKRFSNIKFFEVNEKGDKKELKEKTTKIETKDLKIDSDIIPDEFIQGSLIDLMRDMIFLRQIMEFNRRNIELLRRNQNNNNNLPQQQQQNQDNNDDFEGTRIIIVGGGYIPLARNPNITPINTTGNKNSNNKN